MKKAIGRGASPHTPVTLLSCPRSVTGRRAPQRKLLTAAPVVLGTFSNSTLTSVLEHGKMFNPADNRARLSFRRGLKDLKAPSKVICRRSPVDAIFLLGNSPSYHLPHSTIPPTPDDIMYGILMPVVTIINPEIQFQTGILQGHV